MTLIWRSASFLILITGLCAPAAFVRSAEPMRRKDEPALELPPYRVLADMLTITFRADSRGTVAGAEVTRVTPNSPAAKRDIEIHDDLIAINDRPVAAASYQEMTELIDQELKPSTVLKLSFTGQRGFFNQRHIKYDFVIMRPAADAAESAKFRPDPH